MSKFSFCVFFFYAACARAASRVHFIIINTAFKLGNSLTQCFLICFQCNTLYTLYFSFVEYFFFWNCILAYFFEFLLLLINFYNFMCSLLFWILSFLFFTNYDCSFVSQSHQCLRRNDEFLSKFKICETCGSSFRFLVIFCVDRNHFHTKRCPGPGGDSWVKTIFGGI